jgi:hypothetical protein
MNDPKTLTILYECIENDYSWRIVELSNFKNSVLQAQGKAQVGMIRAGVALLYAHWEGFIKYVAEQYYQFVAYQNHTIEELSDCFVSILLRGELEILSNSKKLVQHNRIIQIFIEEQSKKAYFPAKSPIQTANLKFDIFQDVCIMIGIDLDEFRKHYMSKEFDRDIQLTINEDLVKKRNMIAHGHRLPITLEEYKDLYKIVVNGFLYVFKEQVMNAAQKKKYLRIPNVKINEKIAIL